jgi:hypothetical protein
LNGRDVNGVKVWVPDFGQQPPAEFDRIEPVPDGWKGTPTKQWLAGCWYREQGKCTLMMRYRDDRRESGEYSAFEYRLAGTYAEPVLPDEYMDTVQWAEIFTKPRPGMTVHPNRTIDLEAEVAKVRKHA